MLKLKIENWKHCSKIIFKCVNSAVGPIFNEKIDKKWNLWVCKQCICALFTAESQHLRSINSNCNTPKRVKTKKIKGTKRNLKTQTWNPNTHIETQNDFFTISLPPTFDLTEVINGRRTEVVCLPLLYFLFFLIS